MARRCVAKVIDQENHKSAKSSMPGVVLGASLFLAGDFPNLISTRL